MAMTSERRSTYPLCGAKKKNGTTCRQFAGAGTSHKGVGRCRWHLGNTESHRTHATKVEAQREMATFGNAIDVTPAQALKAVLRITAGSVAWLKARIEVLDPALDTPEARSLVSLYADERDRLTRVSKACLDCGMKQIEIEAAERQTAVMSKWLEAIMDELHLTREQRMQVGPAIRKALPVATGSTESDAPEAPPRTASRAAPVPA